MKTTSWPRHRRTAAQASVLLWGIALSIALWLAVLAVTHTQRNLPTVLVIAAVIVLALTLMTWRAVRMIPAPTVPRIPSRAVPADVKRALRHLTPRRWERATDKASLSDRERTADRDLIETARITALTPVPLGLEATVEMPAGRCPADLEKNLPTLGSNLKLRLSSYRQTGAATATIAIVLRDPLNDGVPAEQWAETLLKRQHNLTCIPVGVDEAGETVTAAPAKLPHMLVAGSTGSGKSVLSNAIIAGIVTAAESPALVLVDPKRVELHQWHAAALHVATEPDELAPAVENVVQIMNHRYAEMAEKGVKNLADHPDLLADLGGPLVLVIDEIADYLGITGKDGGAPMARIAQLGRAACVFLLLATQNPKAELFSKSNGTETLKANLNDVYGLRVIRRTDSEVIFGTGHDASAADIPTHLPGSFYRMTTGNRLARSPYLTDDLIERIANECSTDKKISDLLGTKKEDDES